MALSDEQLQLLFIAKGDTDSARKAFADLKTSIDGDISAIKNKVASVEGGLQSFASGLQNIGKALLLGLTAPLAALSGVAVKSASDLDSLRNNLVSATGSIAAANEKLEHFKKLAADSAGVLVGFAADTYSFLKPMKLGEKTIDNFTKALGKIKLQAPDLDAKDFSLNLSQLFSQNFEQQDLKQLVGRFPRIGELLQKQFQLKGSDLKSLQEGFQKLKEQGKLSIEDFYKGVADSVNNDASLNKLSDTISIRFAKATERIGLALAPLGDAILNLIEPLIPKIVSFIEYLSNGFTSLSPTIQTMIITVGAVAAAIGPVVIAIGGLIGFFAPLIAAIATAGGVSAFFATTMAVIGPVISALVPILLAAAGAIVALGAAAAAVYVLWKTNFGGIRDFTISAFEKIKTIVGDAFEFLKSVTDTVLSAITKFWNDHYSEIKKIVTTVSDQIKNTIQAFLDQVNKFWTAHGDGITKYVTTYYEAVKKIIVNVLDVIGGVISYALKIFTGDWRGAWDDFLKIITSSTKLIVSVNTAFLDILVSLVKAIIPIIVEYGLKIGSTLNEYITKAIAASVVIFATLPEKLLALIPQMINAGLSIGKAVLQGIKDAFTQNPVEIKPDPVRLSKENTYNEKVIDFSTPPKDESAPKNAPAVDRKELYKQAIDDAKALSEKEKLELDLRLNNLKSANDKELVTLKTFYETKKKLIDDEYTAVFDSTKAQVEAAKKALAETVISPAEYQKTYKALENELKTAYNKNITDKAALEEEVHKQQIAKIREHAGEIEDVQKTLDNARIATLRDDAGKQQKTHAEVEQEIYDIQFQGLTRRQLLLLEELKNSGDNLKEKRRIGAEYKALEAELQATTEEGRRRYDEALKKDNETLKASAESKNKILDFEAKREIDSLNFQVQQRTKTVSEAINREVELTLQGINRRRAILEGNLKSATKSGDIAEQKRINDELAALTNEQTVLIENSERRKIIAIQSSIENLKIYRREIRAINAELASFRAEQERKSLQNVVDTSSGKSKIAAIIALRDFEISEANRKQAQFKADLEAEHQAALDRVAGKEKEEEQKFQIEQLYKEKSLLGEEEFQQKLADIKNKFNPEAENTNPGGFLGGFLSGIDGAALTVDDTLGFIGNSLQNLGNVAGNVFGALAQGVGALVQNFVLLGNSGGVSLRKFAAQAIAALASQAAVKALYYTAEGIASLFFNPAASAGYFTAAAIMAGIAGAAAITGRAIAGNSFAQKQTQNAYAGNQAASRYSNTGSKNGGSVYSQYGDEAQKVAVARNAPSGGNSAAAGLSDALKSEITLKIEPTDAYVVRTVLNNFRNNGELRRETIKVIQDR